MPPHEPSWKLDIPYLERQLAMPHVSSMDSQNVDKDPLLYTHFGYHFSRAVQEMFMTPEAPYEPDVLRFLTEWVGKARSLYASWHDSQSDPAPVVEKEPTGLDDLLVLLSDALINGVSGDAMSVESVRVARHLWNLRVLVSDALRLRKLAEDPRFQVFIGVPVGGPDLYPKSFEVDQTRVLRDHFEATRGSTEHAVAYTKVLLDQLGINRSRMAFFLTSDVQGLPMNAFGFIAADDDHLFIDRPEQPSDFKPYRDHFRPFTDAQLQFFEEVSAHRQQFYSAGGYLGQCHMDTLAQLTHLVPEVLVDEAFCLADDHPPLAMDPNVDFINAIEAVSGRGSVLEVLEGIDAMSEWDRFFPPEHVVRMDLNMFQSYMFARNRTIDGDALRRTVLYE